LLGLLKLSKGGGIGEGTKNSGKQIKRQIDEAQKHVVTGC